MREQDDFFGSIPCESQQHYNHGLQAGIQQANSYDMQQIKAEGFIFGQQFGEQVAFYEQFLNALEGPIGNPEQLPHKVLAIVEEIRKGLNQIELTQLDSIKRQRKELARKFKILQASLGIKEYNRVSEDKEAIKEEQGEGLDF